MLSVVRVNSICLLALVASQCLASSVMGAGIWGPLDSGSSNKQQQQQQTTNLGLTAQSKSSSLVAPVGPNWLNTKELESVQYIAVEDSNDYKLVASALISKLNSIKTIEQLNEFMIRLRKFSDRNNYLTTSYLRDNRPVYMEEYNTRVDPRKYAGLELVASILNSADARSLLAASRNGDYKIMSDLFGEYARLAKQHNRSPETEQTLLARANKYPLLLAVFQRLLKSQQNNNNSNNSNNL